MREYGPGRPLVFNHIPKTAGTSLGAALQESLRPSVIVGGLDSSLFGAYDDIDDVQPAMRALIYLSPEELPADATLVAGHIGPGTTMARYPGADHITILRVPQVRVLSQWLHSRSVSEFSLRHWGRSGDAFRVGRLPLRRYLDQDGIAPSIDNSITRFLVWPHPLLTKTEFLPESADDELFDAAVQRLAAFGHVNVVENPRFMAELGAWLGRDLPATQLNERTSVPPAMRPDLATELDPATRELLDHRCRIDVRVWTHVVERVLPDAEPGSLLRQTFDGAAARYAQMLQRPYDASLLRRVVEKAWDVKVRLRPGGRATVGR